MIYEANTIEQIQYQTARMHKAMMAFRKQQGEEIVEELRAKSPFSNFPKGCCSVASQILAKHIANTIHIKPVYIDVIVPENLRPAESCWAHAWLQLGDFVLDITAGQFTPSAPNLFWVMKESQCYINMRRERMRVYDYGTGPVPFDFTATEAQQLEHDRCFQILTNLLPVERFEWREYLGSLCGAYTPLVTG